MRQCERGWGRAKTRPRRGARWAAAWLLVLPLLWAQWLGLVHGISHGVAHGSALHEAQGPAQSDALAAPQGDEVSHRAIHAAATPGLFGHAAEDAAQCRLFDQVGLADAVLDSSWLAPLPAPSTWVPLAVGQCGAQALAGLPQARAPPLTT